ncbi:MAG: dynamin family protein [Magnetospirillum sp. WYHS-4]
MLNGPGKAVSARLNSLETHLRAENPTLLAVVPTFRHLDKVLYRMGLLDREESLASRIPWWPLVSVLGTFSSGKSTFINSLLGQPLQTTGNQAVDDKFTVVCFGPENQNRVLPGMALDADPRFPFYGMSAEVDKVARGEGKRIDAYLQLKTTPSTFARGKIVIDSPGFDADDQRRSILRLTDHIVDLSDLVLVMFDARHPEPGAMADTLQHLVAKTVKRPDAGKFLYILNQIDTAAREDNPEAVVAAWQRAIAHAGLTTGRFYTIYNEAAAVPIADAGLQARFQAKRDKDLGEIMARLKDVEVERQYRIIGTLERVANEVEREIVPALERAIARWRRRTAAAEIWSVGLVLGVLAALEVGTDGGILRAIGEWYMAMSLQGQGAFLAAVAVFLLIAHLWLRDLLGRSIAKGLPGKFGAVELSPRAAFVKNLGSLRGLFSRNPVGWGAGTQRKLQEIRDEAARHVQRLNDLYTDPSGRQRDAAEKAAAEAAAKAAEAAVTPPV